MRGPTQKKHYSNAPIVIRHSLKHATWRNMREPTPEAFSMPRVCQQLLLNSWPLEGTYGNPLRRDSIQVHKVWQELLTIKLLGDTGKKPFKCTKCDACHLKEHMGTHSGEIPFKCTKCDKYFSRSSSLKEHERIHTEEKPFNCSKCYKSFSIATHLKEYERTHMGEKPFKCTNCNKSFSISSYLKTHERIHSGEIPFKCTKCDKSSSPSNYLETPKKSHSSAQSVTNIFQDQVAWKDPHR